MLLVNNEQLDIRKKDDERVQFYLQEREKIKQGKDYVVIKKIKVASKLMKDDKGRMLREPFTTIPCKVSINSERGTELWRYAESSNLRNTRQGQMTTYEPNHFILNDEMHLNPETDTEKIFYLTRIMNVSTCGCEIFDPIADARKRNEKIGGDDLSARYMLFMNKDVSEEQLRTVARAWGLEDADKCQIDILKDKLWTAVEAGEKAVPEGARGFGAFVKDFQNPEKTTMRAAIYKAIHEERIQYNSVQKQWEYKNTKETIIRVTPEMIPRKFDVIMKYYAEHDQEYENLHIDMVGKTVPKKYSEADITLLPDMVAVRLAAKEMNVELAFNIGIDKAKQKLIDSLKS